MNTSVNSLKLWAGKNTSVLQGMSAPLLVVAILALMVLPIPAWLLDTFFTLNIAVALMVMMVAAYMIRPLDFAAFPSVLLLTTLMRLALAGEVQGGRLHVLPCADEIDLAWTQGSREWLALETFIDT